MKGMYFVEMHENKAVASGRVGPQINTDYVFVQYDHPRKYARVVSMPIFSNFALFKTPEEMAAFLAPVQAANSVPAGTPLDKKDAEGLEPDDPARVE